MTPAEVSNRVARIASMTDDDESAHCEEDKLWLDVLKVIAAGADDAAGLAAEALKSESLIFSRWYA